MCPLAISIHIFTKGLPSALFEDFRSSLGVRLPPTRTARATSGLVISSFDVIVPEISIPSPNRQQSLLLSCPQALPRGTNALVLPEFWTHHILLRCDSSGDLNPVTKPSTIPTALFSTSSSTWHQRLGHPDDKVIWSLASHQFISCNKEKSSY
nr:ribonuclease H-like domain-containing protein [Tanacetum cinerariifolium]